MNDDLLLQAILDQPIPTIANIVQAAYEYSDLNLPLNERLSRAYRELTNTDPAALTDSIRLHDPDEKG